MSDVKRREAADRIAAKYYSDRSEEDAPDIEGWLSQPRIYEHMSIALDIAVDWYALEARLEEAERMIAEVVIGGYLDRCSEEKRRITENFPHLFTAQARAVLKEQP